MANDSTKPRLVAILWFVAAALAFVAVAIPLTDHRPPNWGVLAGGSFCLVMGVASLSRKPQPPPSA